MKRKSRILIFSFVLIIILFVNFYPLPYYVSRPGLAKVLDEIIDVENGYENDGEFMLTTIRIGKANIITFLMTKVNEYYQLEPIEAIRLENETDEDNTRFVNFITWKILKKMPFNWPMRRQEKRLKFK